MSPEMDNVGRYRVQRQLGAGSFATVWLGHDDDLDAAVAIKVLAENWAGDEDVRARFLAEARILRRIRDRRVVQVFDIGSLADGRPYFVMDYVDGGSLNQFRRSPLDPVRALQLSAEACRAIEVLHEHDVIHRDVTPGNLLLTAELRPRVLIADLGVAKSLVDGAGATMTAGTPAYMAPEQARGDTVLDRRCDIYALTAVTYALLAGAPPFRVSSLADILSRPVDLEPDPIAERVGAPPSLDTVLRSGLAHDRNRRPPTAAALAEALDAVARQMAGIPGRPAEVMPRAARSASALEPAPAGSSKVEPAPRRKAAQYVLLAAAAVALFALSMFVTVLVLT
jgi:serine/threonine protein kinase